MVSGRFCDGCCGAFLLVPDVAYPGILVWTWACFVGLGGRVSVLPMAFVARYCTMLQYFEDDVVIDQLAASRKIQHKST